MISNNVVCATSKGSDQPAQSDQSLGLSLEYSMTVKLLTEHHLEFPSLKGGYTGSSESTLVKMSHCWKSHVAAHLYFQIILSYVKQYKLLIFFKFIQCRIFIVEVTAQSQVIFRKCWIPETGDTVHNEVNGDDDGLCLVEFTHEVIDSGHHANHL